MSVGGRTSRYGGGRIPCTLLLLACARLAEAAQPACQLGIVGELPVTMFGTEPVISASINGKDARFLADSGAFFSILTKPGAEKFGLRTSALPFGFVVSGVGGRSGAELATVKDFALAGLHHGSLHQVQFLVPESLQLRGVDGVIGQNILRIGDTEYDLANGVIRLVIAKGCGQRGLVYWTDRQDYGAIDIGRITQQEPHVIGTALLNGQKIRVMFDTGASTSILERRVATRLGVTPESPGTVPGGFTGGIGRHRLETWLAPFKSLDLGGEKIANIRIRFGELDEIDQVDMLLGADFFLSHRIYVAKSQSKLYFTYNGGPVFDLRVRNEPPAAAVVPESSAATPAMPEPSAVAPVAPVAPNDYSDAPTDAAGFRRRGAAFMARGDLTSALRDFDRAVELDPDDADGFYARAVARLRTNQRDLARQDLDATLRLRPADAKALMVRGNLRLTSRDLAGARSDFDAASQAAPEDENLELRIASDYERAGQSQEAITRLNEWIATHPKSPRLPSILHSRCWMRAVLGQELELALADCDAALRKLPRTAPILTSRGLVHLRRGEFDAAVRDYRASIALNPKDPSSLYGLGIAELRAGMKDGGEQDLRSALGLKGSIAEEYQRMGVVP